MSLRNGKGGALGDKERFFTDVLNVVEYKIFMQIAQAAEFTTILPTLMFMVVTDSTCNSSVVLEDEATGDGTFIGILEKRKENQGASARRIRCGLGVGPGWVTIFVCPKRNSAPLARHQR